MPTRKPHTDSVPLCSRGYPRITRGEFHLFRELVQTHTGIALGPHKQEMLKARLSRRLNVLGLPTFGAYYRFLCENDPAGEERTRFVNAITTKVTGFFREQHHFQYLHEQWVPSLRERAWHEGGRRIRIWSAGCSTGEESYTLAMTLRESLAASLSSWDVRILASDIDTEALSWASAGTYTLERTAPIPRTLLARHFLRGTGTNAGLVRARSEMQALLAFRHINLIDNAWPIHTQFDAIFCRNVLIYFDRPTQVRILHRLAAILRPGALLFLGHSESLHGLHSGLKHVQNTIYRRVDTP